MMKKASAGWLLFVLAVFIFGGGLAGQGEEPAPVDPAASAPAVAAPVEAAAEAPAAAPGDFKAKVQARVNELKGLPVEELEQAVRRSEETMQQLNAAAQDARHAARELQEKMRLENPDVRAKYAELEQMRRQINVFIDQLPEVKAKLDVAEQAGKQLLEEAWFRTAAMELVAQKDRAAGFPERPEPVVEEGGAGADAPEAAPEESAPATEPKEDLEP